MTESNHLYSYLNTLLTCRLKICQQACYVNDFADMQRDNLIGSEGTYTFSNARFVINYIRFTSLLIDHAVPFK
jgi:hypothetical protein